MMLLDITENYFSLHFVYDVYPLNCLLSYLDVLNAKLQYFISSSTGKMDIYPRECCENKLLRNLVDQRNTQTFL